MSNLNTYFTAALMLVTIGTSFADVPPATQLETKDGSTAATKSIAQDGVEFELINSTTSPGVSTEEYFVKGETPKSWSQTLTFQRIDLPSATSVDLFVTGFQKQIDRNSARLRVVQEGRNSAIFGVQYPASGDTGEEVVLVFVAKFDPKKQNELQVTQYAVNPARMPMEQMETQMKRWQARFQSQAASLR